MRIGTIAGRRPEQIESAQEFPDRRSLLRAVSRGEVDGIAALAVTDVAQSSAELTVVLGEIRARRARLICFHEGEDIGPHLLAVGPALAAVERAAVVNSIAPAESPQPGRPRASVTREQICQLLAAGISKSKAASLLGVSRQTVLRRLDEGDS